MGNCFGNQLAHVHPFSPHENYSHAHHANATYASNYVDQQAELIPSKKPSSDRCSGPICRIKVRIPAKQLSEMLSLKRKGREAALASLLIDKLEANDLYPRLNLEQTMYSSWRPSLETIGEEEELGRPDQQINPNGFLQADTETIC
eukprot:Gb_00759 [translate_table: standard]